MTAVLNRHGEPICDWSDLPTTGCAHCTGAKLDVLADQTSPPRRPARPGVVVQLAAYRGLPYYAPSPVPMPTGGQTCQCGRPAGDAFMCPQCVDDLDRCLGDVPALVEDLDIAAQRLTRLTVTPTPSHKRDPESILDGWPGFGADTDPDMIVTTPLVVRDVTRRMAAILARTRPDAPQAASAQDSLRAALVGAVRALCGSVGQAYNGPTDTTGLSRWLLRNLAAIPLHPEGPNITAEIVRAHDRALKVIDNDPEKIFYGTCQTIMADGAPCGQNVSIPVGATLWECGCGATYDAGQLEADRRERVADTLGTVGELVRLAKHVGVTVSRHKVNRLVTAGRLQSRTEGKAGAMYRLGDLLDTLGA